MFFPQAGIDFLGLFFFGISFLGHPFFWVIASAILFWRGREKESFFLMTLIVLSGVLVGFLKNFFAVPRPSQPEQTFLESILGEFSFDKYSFPSGHAALISGVYAFYRRKMTRTTEFFFLALVFAVAYSRIYLNMHFAIDVAFGILLGLALGRVFAVLYERFKSAENKTLASKEELGLVVGLFLVIGFFLYFEGMPVAGLLLGYYVGLFAFKLLGFDSTEVSGKKLQKKTVTGLFGLFCLFLAIVFFPKAGPAMHTGILFLSGLWITLILPAAYEKALKNKTRKNM